MLHYRSDGTRIFRGDKMSALGSSANHKIQKRPIVLIIDDDIDAIINIENTVQNLGCDTLTATNAVEAQRKLMARKVDLVILDWCLDRNLQAGCLIEKVGKILKKFSTIEDLKQNQKNKIHFVIHSSLSEDQIQVPASEYFTRIEHWQKPLQRNDLVKKTTDVLKVIGY